MRKFFLFTLIATALTFSLLLGALPTSAQDDDSSACRDHNAVAADVFGMSFEDVEAALAEGQTLADLAAANGISYTTLAEALHANRIACQTERLEEGSAASMCRLITGPAFDRAERPAFRFDGRQYARAAFDVLDLDPREIDRDQSMAQLAEAQGMSVDEVISAIVDAATEDLYQMQTAGRLSEEEAGEILSTLQADVTEWVNAVPGANRPANLLDVAQEAIGIESADFYAALIEGQTVAQLAEANGVEVATVEAALRASLQEHLAEMAEQGDFGACVAEVQAADIDDIIDNLLNSANPGRFDGRGGPGGPRGDGGPGRGPGGQFGPGGQGPGSGGRGEPGGPGGQTGQGAGPGGGPNA